jgi:hypothetical protein
MSEWSAPRKFISHYIRVALVLWFVLVAALAIYAFVIPHEPNFAPEIGVWGSFVYFAVMYSFVYFVLASLIGVIAYFVAGISPRGPGT